MLSALPGDDQINEEISLEGSGSVRFPTPENSEVRNLFIE